MSFSNAQLAQKISDLIDYWSNFSVEHKDWLGGVVGGGPNLDGEYPLTDYAGNEILVKSPAQLQDDVDNITTGATAQANAAAASAAAASTSETNAAASAATATAQATLADADRVAAETAETNATNAAVTSTTQANLATDRAGYAQEWANAAFQTLVSSAAGGDQVDDYSALHWATVAEAFAGSIDSNLYGQLAQNEDVTGTWRILTDAVNDDGLKFRNNNCTITVGNAGYEWSIKQGQPGNYDGYLMIHDTTTGAPKMFISPGTNGAVAFNAALQVVDGKAVSSNTSGSLAFYMPYDGTRARVSFRGPNPGDAEYRIESYTYGGSGLQGNTVALFKTDQTTYASSFQVYGDILGVAGTFSGAVTGSNINAANWDAAYGWGNHAAAGYAAGSHGHTVLSMASGYTTANVLTDAAIPVGITFEYISTGDLATGSWGNLLTFKAATSRGFQMSIGDTDENLSYRQQTTDGAAWQTYRRIWTSNDFANNSANWDTAYGWGNHASAGYAPLASPAFTGSVTGTSFDFSDVGEVTRFNIVGGTSGNTHFNWSSGGENYITHGSGDFTRFRGYDGVSTYTTVLDITSSRLLATGVGFETNHSGTKNFPVVFANSGASTTIRSGNYATWGNSYSEQCSFMANNCYMDPADAANQYRYMNTHSTYGHSIYKQHSGSHYWYGDTASVTAGAIVGEQLLAQLNETGGQATLALGQYGTTIGGKLDIYGTTANKVSSLICTNGNLHIDSAGGSQVYLNYYSNTGGVYIGAAGGFKSTLTGQYGAVQTQGSTGGYGGVSLDGNFALMNSGSAHVGLYNDVNNQWFILAYPNSWMQFYNAGTAVMRTSSTGMIHPTAGAYYRNNSTSYLSGAVTFSTGAATGGSSGDIWYQYT